MTKYWILYRDYGYSEHAIYGVTNLAATADAWRALGGENEAAECELTGDSLPSGEPEWLD